jgi:hypothetical protein
MLPVTPVPRLHVDLPHLPYRDGVSCTSPAAKRNGGAGLVYQYDKPPTTGIICGGRGHKHRRGCTRLAIYHGRVTDCSERPFIPAIAGATTGGEPA